MRITSTGCYIKKRHEVNEVLLGFQLPTCNKIYKIYVFQGGKNFKFCLSFIIKLKLKNSNLQKHTHCLKNVFK